MSFSQHFFKEAKDSNSIYNLSDVTLFCAAVKLGIGVVYGYWIGDAKQYCALNNMN